METNQQSTGHNLGEKISKANTIASVALAFSLIALSLSVWMLYKNQSAEAHKPQDIEQKVDKFFDNQDKEFDKMFDEKEELQ